MAGVTRRRGSNSFVIIGRNTDYDTDITSFASLANEDGKFAPKRFPFTRFTLDLAGEQVQSESIVGGGSDTLNTLDTLNALGDMEAEILPEDLAYYLQMAFNPNTTPVSTEIAPINVRGAYSSPTYTPTAVTYDSDGNISNASAQGQIPTYYANIDSEELDLVPAKIVAGGTDAGTMKIKGFRRDGNPKGEITYREETKTLTSTDRDSTYFYTQVDSIDLTGAIASGSPTFKYDPKSYITPIKFGNKIFQGATYTGTKGGVPFTALKVIPNITEITFGASVRLLQQLISSRVLNYRVPTDLNTEVLAWDDSGDTALSNFPISNLLFYPRWGGILQWENDTNDPTPFTNLVLRVNHNLEDAGGKTGSRYAGEPIVGGRGVREVTLEADTFFVSGDAATDTFTRWQQLFIYNQTERVYFTMINFLDDGRMYRTRFYAPVGQLTEVPTIGVEGRGQISRRITMKLVPEATASTPNELKAEILTATQTYS